MSFNVDSERCLSVSSLKGVCKSLFWKWHLWKVSLFVFSIISERDLFHEPSIFKATERTERCLSVSFLKGHKRTSYPSFWKVTNERLILRSERSSLKKTPKDVLQCRFWKVSLRVFSERWHLWKVSFSVFSIIYERCLAVSILERCLHSLSPHPLHYQISYHSLLDPDKIKKIKKESFTASNSLTDKLWVSFYVLF